MDPLSRNLLFTAGSSTRAGSLSRVYDQHASDAVTTSLNIPGGSIQAGDLILVWDWAQNSTNVVPSTNLNTGYVQICDSSSVGNPIFPQYGTREVLSYRIADGTETAIQGITCDLQRALLVEVFRADVPITKVVIKDLTHTVLTEQTDTRTITSDAALIPAVVVSAYGNSGAYSRGTPALSNNLLTYSSLGVEEITVAQGRDWFTRIINGAPETMYSSTTLDPNQDQLHTFTTFYVNVI